MATESQRIAWLRLALAEILGSPDVKTARIAEKALNEDDAEMRGDPTSKHRAVPPKSGVNPWHSEE